MSVSIIQNIRDEILQLKHQSFIGKSIIAALLSYIRQVMSFLMQSIQSMSIQVASTAIMKVAFISLFFWSGHFIATTF